MAERIRPAVSTTAIQPIAILNRSDPPTGCLLHFGVGLHLQPCWRFSDCMPVLLLRPCASSAALPYSWRDGSELSAK